MKREINKEASWGEKEFIGSGVEDLREAKSLAAIADRLLSHPEESFSSAVGEPLRKAAWRIFSKAEVDVSYGHYQRTGERCMAHRVVLVSQDTSDISFPSHPATKGLGHLGGEDGPGVSGVCIHSALAMLPSGFPLGLLGQKVWAPWAGGREKPAHQYALADKENYRWVEGLQWVERYAGSVGQVIVLSDRESDFYEYLSQPRGKNIELLLRAHHLQRKVICQQKTQALRAVVFTQTTTTEVLVAASKTRAQRRAQVQVSWGEIQCPPAWKKQGEALTLRVVIAREIGYQGADRLEWYLLTSLPVNTAQQACQLIDYYRKLTITGNDG